MKCPNCDSDDVTYDSVTKGFQCNKCNFLFNETNEVPMGNKVPFTGWLLLRILLFIPGINIIVVLIASKFNIKDYYKENLVADACFNLLVICSLFVFVIINMDKAKTMLEANGYVPYVTKLFDMGIPPEVPNEPEVEEKEPEVVETVVINYDLSYWDALQNTLITGDKVLSIVENNDNFGFLVQTKDIIDKYGKQVYLNCGYTFSGSYLSDSKVTYLSLDYGVSLDDIVLTYYTDDYMEPILLPCDDLKKRRSIFYIDPKTYYKTNLIHDDNGTLIGIMFSEVSDI